MPPSTRDAPANPRREVGEETLSGSDHLAEGYRAIRRFSETLCESLEIEDFVIQSMPEASPTRWHLAHSSWFFETFVLAEVLPDYQRFDPHFSYLFNSYYNSVGEQFARHRRGILSRPTVQQVFEYRAHVDRNMLALLRHFDRPSSPDLAGVIETGLHHEQQHQELILTDIKHVFSCNPLYPVYRDREPPSAMDPPPLSWHPHEEALHWIGQEGAGFCYDNEQPRHKVHLETFEIGSRLITNREFLKFIDDGGYVRPELWLFEGWTTVQEGDWQAPLYWQKRAEGWCNYTLSGLRPLHPDEPVCHLSYFEAEAYARWAGGRLPTEAEWEIACEPVRTAGNFAEGKAYHPLPVSGPDDIDSPRQMFGDAWEWTASPYVPYPGYRSPAGALGEYNGKFMCNQMVLRGGSCATSRSHVRRSYRNFFPPAARWQFTGVRLARSV